MKINVESARFISARVGHIKETFIGKFSTFNVIGRLIYCPELSQVLIVFIPGQTSTVKVTEYLEGIVDTTILGYTSGVALGAGVQRIIEVVRVHVVGQYVYETIHPVSLDICTNLLEPVGSQRRLVICNRPVLRSGI